MPIVAICQAIDLFQEWRSLNRVVCVVCADKIEVIIILFETVSMVAHCWIMLSLNFWVLKLG